MIKDEKVRELLNLVYAGRDSQQYLMDLSEGYESLEAYHKGKRDAYNLVIANMLSMFERE